MICKYRCGLYDREIFQNATSLTYIQHTQVHKKNSNYEVLYCTYMAFLSLHNWQKDEVLGTSMSKDGSLVIFLKYIRTLRISPNKLLYTCTFLLSHIIVSITSLLHKSCIKLCYDVYVFDLTFVHMYLYI